MSEQLLQTKLYVPAIRPSHITRPHLITMLNQGCQSGGKLTLVSASAGYGKTTLVTEWVSQLAADTHAAWLSLDEGDNDLTRFLTYSVAALQTIETGLGETAVTLLQSPQPPPSEAILTSLVNEITRINVPFLLVLDDYHVIHTQAIHNAVTFLLDNMPPPLHLAIITRSDPPLPLPRLRVRGQMTEIRQADLCFTAVEAATFLNEVMNLSLTVEQVEKLATRTEGWIAGLQLAAVSLRGRDDTADFIKAFSGSHRFVMDYLAEEVIQGQPDQLQQFILQTSILSRLNGPLCEAVTGQADGQKTLEKLEASNLFLIPLDDDRAWFRYHHLFAEVMASRLQQVYHEQIPELHLRAAKWLQQTNLFAEAIDHALAAEAYSFAADLVEDQAMALLRAGNVSTLLRWLNKLPPEAVDDRPKLNVYSAWVYLLIGRQDKIESYLSSAEKNLTPDADNNPLLGNMAAIRAYAAAQLGNFHDAVNQANQALSLLPEDDFPNRAVVSFVLGGVYYAQQDIPQALAFMKEASQLGERAGNIHVAVQALSSLGNILLQQGNLAQAERTLNQAMQLGTGRKGQPLPITASAHVGLARLCLAQQDLSGARQLAEKAVELGEQWANADSQASGFLVLAQIETVAGNADKAWGALEKAKHLAATYQLTPGLEEQFAACEAAISAMPAIGNQSGLAEPLSEHEINVLRLIAAGLSNRETADELYISVNTVKWHLKNIYDKLNVNGRVEAIVQAQELGLL